jgi:hypothetical protein
MRFLSLSIRMSWLTRSKNLAKSTSTTTRLPDWRHARAGLTASCAHLPAFYPVLVHRLAIYTPRFLPTLGHPYGVALRFAHCDQLAAGLAPAGVRPCWAHIKKAPKPWLWGF